jgi:hypothetical protein
MIEYYVYAYLREDGSPYYIGKGKGRRAYSKSHSVKLPADKSRIVFITSNLTDAESQMLEVQLIEQYGRKDLGTGILRNMTNGGDGGEGYKHTKEMIEYLREKSIGRTHSDSHKKYMSDLMTGEGNPMFNITGASHHRYGIPHTSESNEKNRQSNIGIQTGEKNGFFGKNHSDSSRRAMSENHADVRGAQNPRALSIKIKGVSYQTIKEASASLGYSYRYFLRIYKKLMDQDNEQ